MSCIHPNALNAIKEAGWQFHLPAHQTPGYWKKEGESDWYTSTEVLDKIGYQGERYESFRPFRNCKKGKNK